MGVILAMGRVTPPEPVTQGKLFVFGKGADGGLGLGNTTSFSTPQQVGALTTWKKISVGRNAMWGVDTSGRLFVWGRNGRGQLGNGNTTNTSSPVQLGSLTNWDGNMGSSDRTIHLVKSDGTMWGMGLSDYGALGINASGDRSSPTQVGSLTNWSTVSGFARSFMATKTDGTIWSWGHAAPDGQTGQGDIVNDSSPTQIGSRTDWTHASQGGFGGCAISGGRMFCWGRNDLGWCGDGTTTDRCSPVQVGALTDWSKVFVGYATVHAIKTDGSMWAWGYNQAGRLGLGDTTARSSPVQVGSLTNWDGVSICGRGCFGMVKSDGSAWAWGGGTDGRTGLNTQGSFCSPVQIGTSKRYKFTDGSNDGGWYQNALIRE